MKKVSAYGLHTRMRKINLYGKSERHIWPGGIRSAAGLAVRNCGETRGGQQTASCLKAFSQDAPKF
jgi:hypothetical protein